MRMSEDAPAKKSFEYEPGDGSRRRGIPKLLWKDQVEEDIAILGVRNWRRSAEDRSAWKSILCSATGNTILLYEFVLNYSTLQPKSVEDIEI